ncbi:uncharacterized protein LOC135477010 [Liolophura sinensis]|uniref:uncharacterized protein LOC135477010 n=1 Tax=Liolophura sinensis TaxID=3198878 RepID=UPI0031584D13
MASENSFIDFQFSKNVTKNFDQNRRFFLPRLRCTDFLPNMRKVEGFDQDTKLKIRQKADGSLSREANELFLDTLRNSNQQGKWFLFIGTLTKLGYELLRDILTSEDPDIAEIERIERFLEYLTPVIKTKVAPIRLLSALVRNGYLDRHDKENIERVCNNQGDIAGTELLLSRVQRLKIDACSGLRDAFLENNMEGVIEQMSQSYAERSRSPTLCEAKNLTLIDYQQELYSVVPRDKNTVILCPAKSGKRFVALKAIKEHLSLAGNPDGKVAYLVTRSFLAEKVFRRCQVFLSDIPSAKMATLSPGDRSSKSFKEKSVLIAKAKRFENELNEELVKWTDFSLVILELGVDYYEKRNHVYKEIMKKYHQLRQSLQQAQHLPQILVLSTSICGESFLEDLFRTAMETCATFDIHAVALVRKCVNSLRQQVSIPLMESTRAPQKQDRGFDSLIHELISRVEGDMKKVYQSNKMPAGPDHSGTRMAELISPPTGRTSVKYMTWLKTNKSTLGYASKAKGCKHAGFFLNCLKLATIYQAGLFINAECRRFDALNYMRKKLKQLEENVADSKDRILIGLFRDFYDKEKRLKRICSPNEEDTTAFAVKTKLAAIYQGNHRYKAAVLVKRAEVTLYIMFYLRKKLPHVKFECVVGHHQEYSVEIERLSKTGFHVLITTWPILAFHLGKETGTWDYIIRTDCPGHDVITWTHQVPSDERQPVSRFAFPDTESQSPVDLLMESSIEKVTLEIAQQQKDFSELYQGLLNDVRIASSERELWSRSTRSFTKLCDEMVGEFFCTGCGAFVCNRGYVRNLDDLWLGLDPGLIHRLSTVRHPLQIVFSNGYAKLGRFVCKDCGQKWGIIAHVLGKPHLAFAKEGLDYLIDGRYQKYSWKWKYANISVEEFKYNRDLGRCLPSSFCVEGETITQLQMRLPEPDEE